MFQPFKKFTTYDESQETFSTNSTEINMADVNNPKVGDIFYYLGRTQCTVVAETLKPGGVNASEALVQIETVSGTPIIFLYSTSGRYLSTTKRPFYKSWPLSVKAVR